MRRTYINILIIVVGALFSSAGGYAQQFYGGLSGGLSTSEISGDYFNGPSKAGLYFGLFTGTKVSELSSMQLELNYIQKGSRKNPDSLDLTEYLLRLQYLELHLYYRYDIKSFTLEAGPSLGYLAGSYEEVDGWILDDPFNPFDFSLNIGLHYWLTEKLSINVRYSNTVFFPVRDTPSGYTPTLMKGQYNEVLSFTFQYLILNPQKRSSRAL